MFNADDLHLEHGKYKHIIIPPGVKSIKVKMKDTKTDKTEKPKRRDRLEYPRYREDASN